MPNKKIINVNFQQALPQPEAQAAIWKRFDPPKSVDRPNVFVHPSMDRILTGYQAELKPTAFALVRALCTHMQPDRDRHVFWACPTREQIMERAGVGSITTFKKHFKPALAVLGIQSRRRRRGSNIYTWHICAEIKKGQELAHQEKLTGSDSGPIGGQELAHHGGSDNGPSTYKDKLTGQTVTSKIVSRIFTLPETRSIVQAVGLTEATLGDTFERNPLARKFPATWLVALEQLLERDHPQPLEAAITSFASLSTSRPKVQRVDELKTLLAITEPKQPTVPVDSDEEVG